MSILRKFIFALLLPIILILSGCDGAYRDDPRLQRIEKALNEQNIEEEKALSLRDSLQSIPDSELREGERHYKALLFIKASDKAYVTHTSDSLYLTVHHYFSSHNKEALPEVLYYGGRVYSDIGDYPTALKYFQEALDKIEESGELKDRQLLLKGSVLAQTAAIYNQLRLYENALDYMNKSLEVDTKFNDSVNLMYDYQALGMIQLHLDSSDRASQFFVRSNQYARLSNPGVMHTNNGYLAKLSLQTGDTITALNLINKTIPFVPEHTKPTIWGFASDIYFACGKIDSALKYSKKIIEHPNKYNVEQGYQRLLSRSMIEYLPEDSLPEYFDTYKGLLDHYYDENQNNAFI